MGNTNSTAFKLPYENKYFFSYEKQYDSNGIIKDSIDLSNFIQDNGNFIYQIIFNQIINLGYSIKLKVPKMDLYKKTSTIKEIIQSIKAYGFLSSDYTDNLSDLKFTSKCYFPRLKNIKILLSQNHILIAGIIIDHELMKSILPNFVLKNEVSDIIVIVGYNSENILIKTLWTPEVLSINISFIQNIKEIWTILIESPENYLNLNLNELNKNNEII